MRFIPADPDSSAFVANTLEVPRAQTAGVEILCVAIDMGSTLDAPAFSALANEEREHAARFLRHEDGLRHAAARAALRSVLGARLGMAPTALRLERDASGRPRLAEGMSVGPHAPLDFNISHAGRFALIALAEGRRVGVDIELRRSDIRWNALSAAVLAPRDEAYVMSLPENLRTDAFYDVWTAKEALLKALGVGLSAEMSHFSVLGEGGDISVGNAVAHAPHVSARRAAGVTEFDAAWCPAPMGYAACVAWSRKPSEASRFLT